MTPAEIIREMRALLFERGWCRHGLTNALDELCLLGAHNVATGMQADDEIAAYTQCFASGAISALVEAVGCSGPYMLFIWQDEIDRTFDEVIDLLDKAEKIAERAS